MKNKIVSIALAIMLVIALAGNVVLFNRLSKENVNSNDYQEAMSQLVILQNDLDHANETITTLQNEISDMENVISTNTMEDREEEITAEMLENLSAELNEEQQEANEAGDSSNNNNNNDNNNGNNNDNTNNSNNGNSNNNNNTQPQPEQPVTEPYPVGDGFMIGAPTPRQPDNEFGSNNDGLTGGRAQ